MRTKLKRAIERYSRADFGDVNITILDQLFECFEISDRAKLDKNGRLIPALIHIGNDWIYSDGKPSENAKCFFSILYKILRSQIFLAGDRVYKVVENRVARELTADDFSRKLQLSFAEAIELTSILCELCSSRFEFTHLPRFADMCVKDGNLVDYDANQDTVQYFGRYVDASAEDIYANYKPIEELLRLVFKTDRDINNFKRAISLAVLRKNKRETLIIQGVGAAGKGTICELLRAFDGGTSPVNLTAFTAGGMISESAPFQLRDKTFYTSNDELLGARELEVAKRISSHEQFQARRVQERVQTVRPMGMLIIDNNRVLPIDFSRPENSTRFFVAHCRDRKDKGQAIRDWREKYWELGAEQLGASLVALCIESSSDNLDSDNQMAFANIDDIDLDTLEFISSIIDDGLVVPANFPRLNNYRKSDIANQLALTHRRARVDGAVCWAYFPTEKTPIDFYRKLIADSEAEGCVQFSEKAENPVSLSSFIPRGFKTKNKIPEKGSDWKNNPKTRKKSIDECGGEFGIIPADYDLVGIYLDVKNGKHGIREWVSKFPKFPTTATYRTASGGIHLFYKVPKSAVIPQANDKLPGVDIRHRDGYFCVKKEYAKSFNGYDPVDCPADILKWLMNKEPAPAPVQPIKPKPIVSRGTIGPKNYDTSPIQKGEIHDTLTRWAFGLTNAVKDGELSASEWESLVTERANNSGCSKRELNTIINTTKRKDRI